MRINPSCLLLPSLAVLLASNAAAQSVEAPSALSQLSAVMTSGAERSGEVIEASTSHGGDAEGAPAVKAAPRVDVSKAALQKATGAAMYAKAGSGISRSARADSSSSSDQSIEGPAAYTIIIIVTTLTGALVGRGLAGGDARFKDASPAETSRMKTRGTAVGASLGVGLGALASLLMKFEE